MDIHRLEFMPSLHSFVGQWRIKIKIHTVLTIREILMTGALPRILIVDDDADTCELMPIWLELEGERYDVTTRRSFFEASKLIASRPFDLYIFDYAMPETNAAEFCRMLRRVDPKTPIVIYSALARNIAGQSAIDSGADLYLEKPNDLESIARVVKGLLHRPVVPQYLPPPNLQFRRRHAPRSIL